MRANRRQSLAELCNPKLVRLAQVPHRTADREDPKLARRKWQPPHNMGEPQTETQNESRVMFYFHATNTSQQNCIVYGGLKNFYRYSYATLAYTQMHLQNNCLVTRDKTTEV